MESSRNSKPNDQRLCPNTQALHSLDRLVLDVLLVAKEDVLNLLLGHCAQGSRMARRAGFVLSQRQYSPTSNVTEADLQC